MVSTRGPAIAVALIAAFAAGLNMVVFAPGTALTPPAIAAGVGGLSSARALSDEVGDPAQEDLYWPGFDPAAVPLAIFDGASTYLFRHPAPPEGFVMEDSALVWQGRHPSVVANSSAVIGGITTATVMLESFPDTLTLLERVGVVTHEAFHVFQGTTGRRWGANEVDLFLYPVGDIDLIALRRLETEALRRALDADRETGAVAWAGEALELRQKRFGLMDPASAAYDRGIEAHEGTAVYIQYRVSGDRPRGFLNSPFPPDDVRNRAYWTGLAFALLLDRFAPGWKTGFGEDDSRFLDTELAAALEALDHAPVETFEESEQAHAWDCARNEAALMFERRLLERERFLSKPGWRIVFETAEERPLWPQGFDPLNVEHVDGGILHTRFLTAGNEAGSVEVMGGEALTEGVGPHPLFSGIRRLLVTGLPDRPALTETGEGIILAGDFCNAEFTGAEVSIADKTVTVHLHPAEHQPERQD